jgi:hypothetical protein
VVLNPVRAGMVAAPGDWSWSSSRAVVGEVPAPEWLETDAVLRAFAEERITAVAGYRRFVTEGIGVASPWQALKGQIYLGSEPFVERMQARIDPGRPLREAPKRQRQALAEPLTDHATAYADRDRAMAEAYGTGSFRMQAIAEHFGVSGMTVRRAVKRRDELQGDSCCYV